jgi:hypothetical protein
MLKYNIFNSSHTNSIHTRSYIDGQKNKYSVLNEILSAYCKINTWRVKQIYSDVPSF